MLEIKDTAVTFDSVYESDYAPKDEQLKEASILFLPYHNFRPNVEYCFTEYAEDALRYIKENSNFSADIAITDDKYRIIEMHSILIDIGLILVKQAILPVVLSILANYIYDKIKSRHEKSEDTEIRVQIIAEDKAGKCRVLRYEGPASEFSKVIEEADRILKK